MRGPMYIASKSRHEVGAAAEGYNCNPWWGPSVEEPAVVVEFDASYSRGPSTSKDDSPLAFTAPDHDSAI